MASTFGSFNSSALGAFVQTVLGDARDPEEGPTNPGCDDPLINNGPCGSSVGSCYEFPCAECLLLGEELYNGQACYKVLTNIDDGMGGCDMTWEFLGCKLLDSDNCYTTDESGDTPCEEGWG